MHCGRGWSDDTACGSWANSALQVRCCQLMPVGTYLYRNTQHISICLLVHSFNRSFTRLCICLLVHIPSHPLTQYVISPLIRCTVVFSYHQVDTVLSSFQYEVLQSVKQQGHRVLLCVNLARGTHCNCSRLSHMFQITRHLCGSVF